MIDQILGFSLAIDQLEDSQEQHRDCLEDIKRSLEMIAEKLKEFDARITKLEKDGEWYWVDPGPPCAEAPTNPNHHVFLKAWIPDSKEAKDGPSAE